MERKAVPFRKNVLALVLIVTLLGHFANLIVTIYKVFDIYTSFNLQVCISNLCSAINVRWESRSMWRWYGKLWNF